MMGRHMAVIDARVRLPFELRPEEALHLPPDVARQYDRVLNLTATAESTLEDLRAEMDAAGVDHAIVHAEYEFGDGVDAMNAAVATLVDDEPERFSGFGTVSMQPLGVMRATRQVERAAADGLVGVNVQPSFFDLPIDDRRLYPVYAKAVECNLTVAVHSGINYAVTHPIRNDHPLQIDQVACDFPDLRLMACHAGWPWAAEMVAVMRKHPNVCVDFGGLSPRYVGETGSGWEVMFRFMNSLIADQVYFATDWPVFGMRRALSEWRDLPLKTEVLERLLGANARRLIDASQ